VGGPMTRTVADAARVLDVVAGVDPEDPPTLAAAEPGRIPATYTAALDAGALRGARLGVVRRLSNRRGADDEVLARFEEALDALRAAGATIVDPVPLAIMDSVRPPLCSSFRRDLEAYLATRRPDAAYRTLAAIVESGRFHPSVENRLRGSLDDGDAGDPERCAAAAASVERFRAGLRAELAEHRLDALIYPTWSNPPRLVGDFTTPAGDNNQTPAPAAGFPAITVPMGWVRDDTLPVGLQFLGDAWTEARLIGLAYAYEQATRHRRPPLAAR
jgi:amidase